MKFLSTMNTPKLTITHRIRRCQVNPAGQMTLTESTLTLELTLPSILTGIETRFRQTFRNLKTAVRRAHAELGRALRAALVPDLAHFVGVA